MRRLNFTLDVETVALLDRLADRFYDGNKSATVRAALEYLSDGMREGWIIAGYTAASVEDEVACHSCGTPHHSGDVLYRPVFERGASARAMHALPKESWFDCSECVVRNVEA
jgi:hypothetical protein